MFQIFLTNLLPKGSFLKTKLLVQTYHRLRPGQLAYPGMVWQDLGLDPKKFQYQLISAAAIDLNLAASLLKNPVFNQLADSDQFLVWDLRFVPQKSPKISNLIQTAIKAKKSLLASYQEATPVFLLTTKAKLSDWSNQSVELAPDRLGLDDLVSNTAEPETAQELMISKLLSRSFNNLTAGQFLFTKTSSQVAKIQAEHNFLAQLPVAIKHFYPQVLDLRLKPDQASYDLERVFSFDVAVLIKNQTIFCGQALSELFSRLQEYLKLVPIKIVSPVKYRAKLTELFVTKLADRVAELEKLAIFPKLNQVCQEQGFKDLADFHQQLSKNLQAQIKLSQVKKLEFSHGDLTACNLLYDLQTQQLKLVDPRGWQKSEAETWRPKEYDLAKLSHSFLGGYDLITADLAKLVLTPAGVKTEFLLSQAQLTTLATEFKTFLKTQVIKLNQLRLYEASLFLSLIPLHAEAPDQNLIFLARALEIYAEVTQVKPAHRPASISESHPQ